MIDPSTIKQYTNILDISDRYQGVLLDAYGVFWGGNAVGVLPGCRKTMETLVSNGKIVGILSNSTQLEKNEVEKLKSHGLLEGKHFHFLITSGGTAKKFFFNQEFPFPVPHKKYYSFGNPHPKFSSTITLFEGSSFSETKNIKEADFIYIAIPHIDGEDQRDPKVFEKDVVAILQHKLPMVCANPDHFAHEGTPAQLVVRQGAIAEMYEKIGGDVFYIGKPSDKMFLEAMKVFATHGITNRKQIVMVGDTPETDIRGASRFGMPSALILSTGITAERLSHSAFDHVLSKFSLDDFPTYFLKGLA